MLPLSGWCAAICAAGCIGGCHAACAACAVSPIPFDEVAGYGAAPAISVAGAGIAAGLASAL